MSDGNDNDTMRVKLEIDESAGDIDLAREKFESALQNLLFKEDLSESEPDESFLPSSKQSIASHILVENLATEADSASITTRPPRKRRRKDGDTQGGVGAGQSQSSNSVVCMFDRCVDLANFEANAPLYPICRAWLLNEPHQQKSYSELNTDPLSLSPSADATPVLNLPEPAPWAAHVLQLGRSPLIPNSVTEHPLYAPYGTVSGENLLSHNLQHWRKIRQTWKQRSTLADVRYEKSADVLKSIYRNPALMSLETGTTPIA